MQGFTLSSYIQTLPAINGHWEVNIHASLKLTLFVIQNDTNIYFWISVLCSVCRASRQCFRWGILYSYILIYGICLSELCLTIFLNQVCNGATYVHIDMLKNKKDSSKMLIVEGMEPYHIIFILMEPVFFIANTSCLTELEGW